MPTKNEIVKPHAVSTIDAVQHAIVTLRGKQVLLDFQLAQMYGVETKALKRAVKRNIERFEGDDFMFELDNQDIVSLRNQIGTSNGRGGNRYTPMAFTELGVAMLSSVLNSVVAIEINRNIMRAFVMLRHIVTESRENTLAIDELRTRMKMLEDAMNNSIADTNAQTEKLRQELDAIHRALQSFTERPTLHPRRRIGFNEETID